MLYLIYPVLLFISIFSRRLRKNITIRFDSPKIPQPLHGDRFWFHAASVGEYEQIRPMILKIKKEHPEAIIYMSIFSSSGYPQCYESQISDYFFPLPFDFYFTMKKLMHKIRPKVIFYSRYDIWPNMAKIAYRQGVQQILISATLPKKSLRRHFIFAYFYYKIYSFLNHIFVIDQLHKKRFQEMKLTASVAGDTRYESIQYRIQHKNYTNVHIQSIQKSAIYERKKILIAGSTYSASEDFLLKFIHKTKIPPLLILAPHCTEERNISMIKQKIDNFSLSCTKYTEWMQNHKRKICPSVFLIDTPGVLLQLYSIGDCSYIGGGWQGSVHSTIEPAFFKIPILTGPHIDNSQDALDFNKIGLIRIMKKPKYTEIEAWYQSIYKLDNCDSKKDMEIKVTTYIQNKMGASDTVYNKLHFLK